MKPKLSYPAKLKEPQKPKAGSPLIVQVNFTGIPMPTVTWTLNDQPLTSTNGLKIDTKDGTSTLTLKAAQPNYSGQLKVKVENKAGSDEAVFEVVIKGGSKNNLK